VAKLHFHSETKEKSINLISFQRYLKTNLEKQGFEFLIAGNVRAQKIKDVYYKQYRSFPKLRNP